MHRDIHVDTILTLGRVFKHVHPYYGTVMMYPGGAWSWTYASKGVKHTDIKEDRAAHTTARSYLYNRDVHLGAFAIPNHVKQAIAQRG